MKKDIKVPLSLEEFTKLLKWYEYTLRFEKAIKAPIEKSIEMEYYLISSTWIENFKNKLNYRSIKEKFIMFKEQNKIVDRPLNNNEINYIFNIIHKNIPLISNSDKEEIKRINNNKNIVQTNLADTKYKINYYFNKMISL